MNILYITNHLNIGGITSYVLTLSRGFIAKGHRVYIASSGGELLPNFLEAHVEFIKIPIRTKQEISPAILFSYLKLKKAIKKHNIEIIHAHSRTTQVLAFLLQKQTGAHFISTCHGFFKPRIFRRAFGCWGEKVIAISEQVREHLLCDFSVAPGKVTVVNNGIDVRRFSPDYLKEIKRPGSGFGLKSGPVIGIVARLSDVKGHIYLIRAMKIIIETFPHAQLLSVGEGKMKQELKTLAEDLNIKESILFIPEAKDTREALASMDVFVMPSLKEGLGLALMEAMSSGLAVVGSDVGGIRTLIADGQSGILVQSQDSLGLASAISALLQDPQRREMLGRNARNFIAANFSQEKMIDETERVYRECLG